MADKIINPKPKAHNPSVSRLIPQDKKIAKHKIIDNISTIKYWTENACLQYLHFPLSWIKLIIGILYCQGILCWQCIQTDARQRFSLTAALVSGKFKMCCASVLHCCQSMTGKRTITTFMKLPIQALMMTIITIDTVLIELKISKN